MTALNYLKETHGIIHRGLLFLFIIFTASSVTSEAKKSYVLMNELMALNVKFNFIRTRNKFKVYFLNYKYILLKKQNNLN